MRYDENLNLATMGDQQPNTLAQRLSSDGVENKLEMKNLDDIV